METTRLTTPPEPFEEAVTLRTRKGLLLRRVGLPLLVAGPGLMVMLADTDDLLFIYPFK